MTYDKNALKLELALAEGRRPKPYTDTTGHLTIGVGRDLIDNPLSDDEIDYLLGNDITRVEKDLDRHIPWWRDLTDARQRVLADMAFNMGWGGLSAFEKMLAATEDGDYIGASKEMLNSKWAGQVGARAQRLAKMMVEG